jgi:hypothetical protein
MDNKINLFYYHAFTHHAWSDFLPAFLNLTCGGFFLWGNYSHFFSFAQSPILFANASAQKSWEVLKMCVSIAYQKETKKLEESWAWGALFFAVWEGGATLTFHIFIAWTHQPRTQGILPESQKSYLLNTLISPSRTNYKFVTSLSFHKNNNYSHIYWIIHSKSLTNQVAKQTSRSQGLFRWPSNRGSKKSWVRGCEHIRFVLRKRRKKNFGKAIFWRSGQLKFKTGLLQ